MSDYLTNIAARSFGRVPIIQPRLPSLFEPATQKNLAPPPTSLPAAGPAPRPESECSDLQSQIPASPSQPTLCAPQRPVRSPATRISRLLPPRLASDTAPQLSAQGAATVTSAIRTEPIAAARCVRRAPHTQPALDVAATRPPRSSLPIKVFARPQVIQRVEPATPPPLPPVPARPQSEPAPSIRVTIGRIEVRAAMPPERPTSRLKAQAPTLSLDEYLKQRNGGRQ